LLDQLWLALPVAREQAPEELAQLTRPSVIEACRPQLQTALQAFLLALADRHGLVLAVDDLEGSMNLQPRCSRCSRSQAERHRL